MQVWHVNSVTFAAVWITVVKSWVYMYVDDTKITTQIATVSDCEILQMDLDQLYLWADTWQLKFKTNKCKVIHFGHSNVKSRYSMGGNFLADVLTEKDLGVLVDDKLSFSNHISSVVLKANRLQGLIKHTFRCLDQYVLKKLYVAIVHPHLEYASVVWHPRFQKDRHFLEQVQHRATRLVPGFSALPYEERL